MATQLNPDLLGWIEAVLLVGAGVASTKFVRAIALGDRKVVVMSSVAVWLVAFGILPFAIFSLLEPKPGLLHRGGPLSVGVLNAVPFMLPLSVVIGVVQGLRFSHPTLQRVRVQQRRAESARAR